MIESTEMPQVSSTRFLGVIVGENLSWREQVDWVSKKVNKLIVIMRKISHLVSLNALLILYYSLIYPDLSYSQNSGPPRCVCIFIYMYFLLLIIIIIV